VIGGSGGGRVLDFDFESKPLWFWWDKPTAVLTSVSYMTSEYGAPSSTTR
jgi:hypothetical protein